jgi:magnesium transporter
MSGENQEGLRTDDPPEQQPAPEGEHDVGLSDAFIAEILELEDHNYTDRIQELCRDLSGGDVAELLGKVDADKRHHLVQILETVVPPDTFTYLDRTMMNDLFAHMSAPHIASIVNELDSDDAIHLIDELDGDRRVDILRNLSRKVRAAVEEGLTFPEQSAGRLMQREFVAIPQFWTIGKTVDYLRAAAEALPDRFYDLFIVDPAHRFVGSVSLDKLLCAQRAVKVDTLVNEEHVTIPVTMNQSQIAFQFRRKDLLSAPVVDEEGRLIGVITVDDVVDVIDEEAEKDILNLGGVSDSDIHLSMAQTAKLRSIWLTVNLGTAFLDTLVINMFSGAIEKIVALAALMPIVASMGGNAGTQTLTVVIRALATKEVSAANALRVTWKECSVGIINGLFFAVVMWVIVMLFYHDNKLALVMGAALIFNLFAAGLTGALIPLGIAKLGLDPAPSSAIFLTTVTDVVGFMAFLGLASWFLM